VKILALAGGVGGAKLAHGLAQILPPEDLTVIVNTGDDFEHLGLYISPDLDTVCYTLAGLANPETGWGRADETWNAMANLKRLGAPDWFNLGDNDLATHVERTRRLKEGKTLSEVTREFCAAWGIRHTVLPMSNDPVRTIVETDEGDLPFQEYFVHRKCEPRVKAFRFEGLETASPAPGTREAIQLAEAILVCPSNPWVSVDPILRVLRLPSPVPRPPSIVAVSPIIGGKTVKGPAAKMFAELGIEPSALAVAEHYENFLTGIVVDSVDSELAKRIRIPTLVTDTLMNSIASRVQLAQKTIHFAGNLLS
jgi:LPPG:FO 2-phospho-L-lactate transferase